MWTKMKIWIGCMMRFWAHASQSPWWGAKLCMGGWQVCITQWPDDWYYFDHITLTTHYFDHITAITAHALHDSSTLGTHPSRSCTTGAHFQTSIVPSLTVRWMLAMLKNVWLTSTLSSGQTHFLCLKRGILENAHCSVFCALIWLKHMALSVHIVFKTIIF